MNGAALPLAVIAMGLAQNLIVWVPMTSLLFLAVLEIAAARVGGAAVVASAWRVTFWGLLAMGITAGVSALFAAVT